MPNSKKRETQRHRHLDYIPHEKKPEKKKGSAKPVAIIFCGLVGFFIAWLATTEVSIWLLVGIVIGAGLGYFMGSQMDKSMTKG